MLKVERIIEPSRSLQARVIKGMFKGITGLLSSQTCAGVFIIWGELGDRPHVYGPFALDEVEILE